MQHAAMHTHAMRRTNDDVGKGWSDFMGCAKVQRIIPVLLVQS